MYNITSLSKSEINNNIEMAKRQVTERNIKLYQIHSLFSSLLKDFYINKYGESHVERFNAFVDPFMTTAKVYDVYYHIVVDFSNIQDYHLTISVTSNNKAYINIEKIKDSIQNEAKFEVEYFDEISFDKNGELAQTFNYLIEVFNK